jgi:hypothetical protein
MLDYGFTMPTKVLSGNPEIENDRACDAPAEKL